MRQNAYSRQALRTLLLAASLVVVIDQLTKAWVTGQIPPGQTRVVIPSVLQIAQFQNFGLLQDLAPGMAVAVVGLLGLVAVALAAGARRWLTLAAEARRWMWLSTGLVLGGVLSNLVDRVRHGPVTDFLIIAPTSDHPVFPGQTHLGRVGQTNPADLAIALGVLGLLIVLFRCQSRPDRVAPAAHPPDPRTREAKRDY